MLMQKNVDGKNYYTFEYVLTSPNFARAAFATIAVGNGTPFFLSFFISIAWLTKPLAVGDFLQYHFAPVSYIHNSSTNTMKMSALEQWKCICGKTHYNLVF